MKYLSVEANHMRRYYPQTTSFSLHFTPLTNKPHDIAESYCICCLMMQAALTPMLYINMPPPCGLLPSTTSGNPEKPFVHTSNSQDDVHSQCVTLRNSHSYTRSDSASEYTWEPTVYIRPQPSPGAFARCSHAKDSTRLCTHGYAQVECCEGHETGESPMVPVGCRVCYERPVYYEMEGEREVHTAALHSM